MILPLGATSPDTGYSFPYLYGLGYGYGGRAVPRDPVPAILPVQAEIRDTVSLSPAAQRLIDQAERLREMKLENML